jgi:Hydantoinase/oxoprolinase N-terminal region
VADRSQSARPVPADCRLFRGPSADARAFGDSVGSPKAPLSFGVARSSRETGVQFFAARHGHSGQGIETSPDLSAANDTGGFEIGVDIGGTFTDIVCYRRGEPLHLMKVSSTRSDPCVGVLNALGAIRERWGVEPRYISRFVHGATVATNAVLERKGARVGLITTAGLTARTRAQPENASPDL